MVKKFKNSYIQSSKARYSSFSKRKSGIFSKARQLSETTGESVLLVFESEGGNFYWQATGPEDANLEHISTMLIEEHRTSTSFIHGETRGDEKTPGKLTNHLSVRARRRLNEQRRQHSAAAEESPPFPDDASSDGDFVHTPSPQPPSGSVTDSVSKPTSIRNITTNVTKGSVHRQNVTAGREVSTIRTMDNEPSCPSGPRSRFVKHPFLCDSHTMSHLDDNDFGFEDVGMGQSLLDLLQDLDKKSDVDDNSKETLKCASTRQKNCKQTSMARTQTRSLQPKVIESCGQTVTDEREKVQQPFGLLPQIQPLRVFRNYNAETEVSAAENQQELMEDSHLCALLSNFEQPEGVHTHPSTR